MRPSSATPSPSPGTPGEGWGGGLESDLKNPHPHPPPEYREREMNESLAKQSSFAPGSPTRRESPAFQVLFPAQQAPLRPSQRRPTAPARAGRRSAGGHFQSPNHWEAWRQRGASRRPGSPPPTQRPNDEYSASGSP